MRFSRKRQRYENSTKSLVFYPTFESYSYGWYKVSDKIYDQVLFNTYNYSPTTIKHVSTIRDFISATDYICVEAPDGLSNIDSAIRHYQYLIQELEEKVSNPRCHKRLLPKRLKQLELLKLKNGLLNAIKFERGQVFRFLCNKIKEVERNG